jgi:hypothetical protein
VIYDPATTNGSTRAAFLNNAIPQDRIDPVAAAVLNYYPLPNRPGTSSNFVGTTVNTLDRNIVMGRVDHQLTQNDRLTGGITSTIAARTHPVTTALPHPILQPTRPT